MDGLQKRRALRDFAVLVPFLLAGAGCGSPHIAGLHPEMTTAAPGYRDLADIPAKPTVTADSDNKAAVAALDADKAKTNAAAGALRGEKVVPPEPYVPEMPANAAANPATAPTTPTTSTSP
jgi:hypothetical protein